MVNGLLFLWFCYKKISKDVIIYLIKMLPMIKYVLPKISLKLDTDFSILVKNSPSDRVIKFNSHSWTADSEVHVVHISHVIIAYPLE